MFKKSLLVLSCFSLLATPAMAQDNMEYASDKSGQWAVSAKAGTLGLGLEARYTVTDKFAVRLGGNLFSLGYDGEEDGVDYEFDLKLKSINLMADFHPFEGAFRLTGGLLYNGNKILALGASTDDVEIGDVTYTPAEIGTLTGDIKFKDIAPYLGIGWGKSLNDSGLAFTADLGVMFSGAPEVSLNSNGGLLSSNADFLAELRREEQNLQGDLDNFKYYPVIALGLSYSF